MFKIVDKFIQRYDLLQQWALLLLKQRYLDISWHISVYNCSLRSDCCHLRVCRAHGTSDSLSVTAHRVLIVVVLSIDLDLVVWVDSVDGSLRTSTNSVPLRIDAAIAWAAHHRRQRLLLSLMLDSWCVDIVQALHRELLWVIWIWHWCPEALNVAVLCLEGRLYLARASDVIVWSGPSRTGLV